VTHIDAALGDTYHAWPQLLPSGKALLFTAVGPSAGSDDSRIVVQDLETKKRKNLVEKATFGRYLPTGHLLYSTNSGTIFAVPFDLQKFETTGNAVPVLSDIGICYWGGGAFLSASDNGTLIYLKPSNRPTILFRTVDRDGKDTEAGFRLDPVTARKLGCYGLQVSPDGKRAAVWGGSAGGLDIWIVEASGEVERVTLDPAEDESPAWSSDGKSIAYSTAQPGTRWRIQTKSINKGIEPHLVRIWPRHAHVTSWSPDGQWLLLYDFNAVTGNDIYAISLNGKDAIPIATEKAGENAAEFSPDGRWITYSSNQSGRIEVYAVSFPDLRSRRQVSSEGGTSPHWDRNGRILYYLQNGYLVAQEVDTRDEFRKGNFKKLFATKAISFEVGPGPFFLITERNTEPPDAPLYLITNWFDELKRIVSTGKKGDR
jgi:serine/threonine-protein kinase